MASSRGLEKNSVRDSGYLRSSGLIRHSPGLVCFCIAFLACASVPAAIVTDGHVYPPYPGSDPWDVGGPLAVAGAYSGSMTVNGGSDVINTDGWVASSGESNIGTITIDGNGSTWENTGNLSLGNSTDSGVGHLTTLDEGNVYVGDAAGSGGLLGWRLTVSDSDESGESGGQLYLYNGSTLTHGGNAFVGDNANEYGWATVDGSGSSWSNGASLSVGMAGFGNLTVRTGGTVSAMNGAVGYLGGSAGIVTVNGANSSWTNSGTIEVGVYGEGVVNVQNGGRVLGTNGRIGHYSGSIGTVTIDGSDSIWENTGDLSLGRSSDSGVGQMTISGGGTVLIGDAASGGPAGWLIVSDTNSDGADGGHLRIYNGSTLTHGNYARVGCGTGGVGWVTVDGAGSSWTNSKAIQLGQGGSGTLTIQNRGTVTCQSGQIGAGNYSTGTATIDGAGSSWMNATSLYVGTNGSGTLIVQNGATVYSSVGTLAFNPGSTGTVTVDGNGSSWINSRELMIAGHGPGTLTIQNGGSVSNTQGVIGGSGGNHGTVTVDGPGSSWINNGRLLVGEYGLGTLNVQNGATISATEGFIGYGSTSSGTANVNGTDSSWINNGSLHVGREGPGTLTISEAGLVRVAGTLTIDGDLDGDGFINMTTGGMLALFGYADDSLLDFLGLVQGTDAIRWWDDSLSDWALLTTATEGTDYTLEYLTEGELLGYTLLTVGIASLPGDLNDDGFVGGDDLDIIRSFWGQSVPAGDLLQGDPSGDGFVGGDDLDIVRANWGQGIPPSAVPEPSTLAGLLVVNLAGILVRPGGFRRSAVHGSTGLSNGSLEKDFSRN